MSSAGVSVAAAQPYFCYQCNRTITLTPSPNSDLSCPNCNDGFLEELQQQPDPPHPSPFPSSPFSLLAGDPFFFPPTRGPILFSSTSVDLQNPRNFSFFGPSSVTYGEVSPAFNPFEFLQDYLHNLRSTGANVQFVIENHPSEPGFRLPPHFGDYFLGPGLEQLIQQLAENDPNRYGTPPASKKAVEGLPDVDITEAVVNSDCNSCAVCMNDFELGSKGKQMPCKHLFHADCLLPWLELHNSCPICRFELPTDDQDYENRKAGREQGTSSSGSSASGDDQGGSQGIGGGERRFRISFPWPFSAFASSGGNTEGGARNNNDDNNNRNNNGSNSGDQQSGNHGSEPRQESLD